MLREEPKVGINTEILAGDEFFVHFFLSGKEERQIDREEIQVMSYL